VRTHFLFPYTLFSLLPTPQNNTPPHLAPFSLSTFLCLLSTRKYSEFYNPKIRIILPVAEFRPKANSEPLPSATIPFPPCKLIPTFLSLFNSKF